MFQRILTHKAKNLLEKYPILTVTGPRQSGKTTLIKSITEHLDYVNLEQPDIRTFAENDPKGFIENYLKGAIFDEIQNVPEFFSYLQVISDEHPNSKFILSGSQNFLLMQSVSQSLAGRTAILNLLPFSYQEIKNYTHKSLWELIYTGFYPRIYDKNIPAVDFYPYYIQTYLERDIRQLINVMDLNSFNTFLKLCAGRIGQLINVSSLANDTGISPNTAKKWLSALETSYVIYRLKPHHNNFNKRLTKQSKLYFYDTGLACSLLQIGSAEQLKTHYLKGGLFENFVITELIKKSTNKGKQHSLYFWRDHKGKEIDCIIDQGNNVTALEIKSGSTFSQSYFDNLKFYKSLAKSKLKKSIVVYTGVNHIKTSDGELINWQNIDDLN
ncbi:ATP-binding protein [Flavobacteriaceae bacterium 14752]|uniref:ATP-binding protein n=1 Tax=Mesohalobacter salilacus TaxID=2491711 RepID=UPI000F644B51|nr:ATP-binding protein [Flavobacteriaceae bacterium 14752]